MNFKVAPDAYQKLLLLDSALDFEPAGGEPVFEGALPKGPQKEERPGRAPKALPCISEVSTPTGKKPVLKAMITTACERNCFYCPFRAGRNKTQRLTFTPDEMAKSFNTLQRAQVADGLFLSSGIIKGSVTTQDKIIDTAEILRHHYGYRGYIHLKIMPNAEYDQIRRAMQLANRVSINLEGATEARLRQLAPQKEYWSELFQRIQWISQLRAQEQLRASIVTQFVVGAVGDTDIELLETSEKLYRQFNLQRTYYMAFSPVSQTPFETLSPTTKQREYRLYQASFLLRDYNWELEDLSFENNGNLNLTVDPKEAWAVTHLQQTPIEINHASRADLLRVPGIGPKSADAIVAARRQHKFTEVAQLRTVGVRDTARATPYILLNGRRPLQQLSLFGN